MAPLSNDLLAFGEPSKTHADKSDAELLDLLRSGDTDAYEQLWRRHVDAAKRVARRLSSSDHDDLVSDAFLAVFRQVAIEGKGPQASFRAYLFTTMRNTAARWSRQGRTLISDPDADAAVDESGYEQVEREHEGAQLLDAFRALPDRWQRVLWLAEVEEARRPAIASELGIKPNAVSALQRRARTGLREQWLLQQVPADLRSDSTHVARRLPASLLGMRNDDAPELKAHLKDCALCRSVERDLLTAYADGRSITASVSGLAALGVILPGATTIWAAPTSISIAAGIGFTLASAAAVAGIVSLGVGIGVIPPLFPAGGPAPAAAAPSYAPEKESPADLPPLLPAPDDTAAALPPSPPPPSSTEPPIEEIDFWRTDGEVPPMPARPAPPTEANPDDVPAPAETGGTPPEPGTEQPNAAPAVTTASPASTYMAPVLSGAAPESESVALRFGDALYTVAPGEDGSWEFDARSLSLPAGEHQAEVWTVTDGVSSPATLVGFTIDELAVDGFQQDVLLDLEDASTTGLVLSFTGPAGGLLCVTADTGQAATVPLDDDGTVTRRMRFLTTGLYVLTFETCSADGFYGPAVGRTQWVSTGIFDPWGDVPEFVLEETDAQDPASGEG
ncbi:RNA polymerase sigma factor [Microbacterium esteraromaticum]|uniref:RNA polymerase sigma factor n=1 Tax=Microbacterium esteraromaticum TaxID=57043 RepID=UPI0015F4E461|nr:sigma-70 family RNA polymerase sigma factor [Microbacterium esteraromaticum]